MLLRYRLATATRVIRPSGLGRCHKLYSSSISLVTQEPNPSAPRYAPTPLLFLSLDEWDNHASSWMKNMMDRFGRLGFASTLCKFTLPSDLNTLDSQSIMDRFEADMKMALRQNTTPFPPVIFARSTTTLIAQTYISSNPASGLVLLSPPLSNLAVPADQLPTQLREFDYEPLFPLALVATPAEMSDLTRHHRLGDAAAVDKLTVDDVEGDSCYEQLQQWIDDIGV